MITDICEYYVVDMLHTFCGKDMRCRLSFSKLSKAKKYASSLRKEFPKNHISILVKTFGCLRDF